MGVSRQEYWSGLPLPSLITVARSSQTMLNKSGVSGHLCIVSDFKENDFSFLELKIIFTAGFSYMAFIMLSYAPMCTF